MEDFNNYSLIAYNPNDKNSVKYIEIEGLKRYNLVIIDKYLTNYTKESLLERLQNKCIITPDQTELAIVYKQDGIIKKMPIIFNNRYLNIISRRNGAKIDIKKDVDANNFINQFVNNLTSDKNKIIYKKSINPDYDYEKDSTLYCSDILKCPFVLAKLKNRIIEYITSSITKMKYGNNTEENELIKKNNNAKFSIKGTMTRYDVFRNMWLIKNGYIELNENFLFDLENKPSTKINEIKHCKNNFIETQQTISNYDMIRVFIKALENENFLDMVCDNKKLSEKFKNTANKYNKTYYLQDFPDYEDHTPYLIKTLLNNKKVMTEMMKIYKEYVIQLENQKKIVK